MDNVIDFSKKKASENSALSLGVTRKKFCKCIAVTVCEHSRTMECRQCGASVDPFQWALKMCSDWEKLETNRKTVRADLERKMALVATAKKELKNVKARLTSAKRALRELPVARPVLAKGDTTDWLDIEHLKAEIGEL